MSVAPEDGEPSTGVPVVPPEPPTGGVPGPIALEDALTIADAGHWHARLLAAAGPGADLVIDASRLEHVDGAGAQLLAAAFRDGDRRGYRVVLQDPSPALREAAARLGLSSLLRLDADATA